MDTGVDNEGWKLSSGAAAKGNTKAGDGTEAGKRREPAAGKKTSEEALQKTMDVRRTRVEGETEKEPMRRKVKGEVQINKDNLKAAYAMRKMELEHQVAMENMRLEAQSRYREVPDWRRSSSTEYSPRLPQATSSRSYTPSSSCFESDTYTSRPSSSASVEAFDTGSYLTGGTDSSTEQNSLFDLGLPDPYNFEAFGHKNAMNGSVEVYTITYLIYFLSELYTHIA